MSYHKTVTSNLAATVFLGGQVFAQATGAQGGSGATARAGAGAAPRTALSDGRLARADRNRNGRISFQELSRVIPDITREEFTAADTNRDGTLSRAELQAAGNFQVVTP